MEKKLLEQYSDACELIKETEERIAGLKEARTTLIDKTEGSSPEYPWIKRSFKLEGFPEEEMDLISREEHLLYIQKADACNLKLKVEKWLSTTPMRIRRIVHLKYFDNYTWEEVGMRLSGCSGESVRKELDRYLKENF